MQSIWICVSVTRWLDNLFNVWPFTIMKCPQKQKIFAKAGSKCCQILNYQKVALDFLIFDKMAKFHQIWSHWFASRRWKEVFYRKITRQIEQIKTAPIFLVKSKLLVRMFLYIACNFNGINNLLFY